MAWGLTKGEGGREAKRSRVRGTTMATGEDTGRGREESKEKGMGSKRGGGAAAWLVPPLRSNKVGTNHMDLLYETKEDKMVCQMCRCVVHYHHYLFSISYASVFLFMIQNFKPQGQPQTTHQPQAGTRDIFGQGELGRGGGSLQDGTSKVV